MEEYPEDQIAYDREWTSKLETRVIDDFKVINGRAPSQSEIANEAQIIASQAGRDYVKTQARLNRLPGPIRKAVGGVIDKGKELLGDAGAAVVSTVADRTPSLRAQDSSLPTIGVPRPFRGSVTVAQDALGLTPGEPIPLLGYNGEVTYAYTPSDYGEMTFGAEDLADVIEIGGPLAGEAYALAGKSPTGFAFKTVVANVGSEVLAELLRAYDRKAAQLPNSAFNISDPEDAAMHFAKVAAGGVVLGSADLLVNSAELRAQRRLYKTAFGLDTATSKEQQERMLRLGVNPNLAQASTGFVTAIAASLNIYPLTARRSVRQDRKVLRGLQEAGGAAFPSVADHLLSGVHLSEKSRRWFAVNDEYLRGVRQRGGNIYKAAEEVAYQVERKLGLDNVHVPHAAAREKVEDLVLRRVAQLPPATVKHNKFGHREPIKARLEKDAGYGVLERVMRQDDKVSIVDYRALKAEVEAQVARFEPGDPLGSVYTAVASFMREAERGMVAPQYLKDIWVKADAIWGGMHALSNESTWRNFKKANSKFGHSNKQGAKQTISTELVLETVLSDKKLTAGEVITLATTAKRAGASEVFTDAVGAHYAGVWQRSLKTLEKGSLAGEEVLDFKAVQRQLGLIGDADEATSTLWEANAELIRQAGGDPALVRQFLDDATQAFPMGMANPAKAAQRRTALAGAGSAVRLATGIGALAATQADRGENAVIGGVLGAVSSIMFLATTGEILFNPAVLKRMNKVMRGGISEQGKWRTIWGITTSLGITRSVQNMLQEQGIDPLVTPAKAQQEARGKALREATEDRIRQQLAPFRPDPMTAPPPGTSRIPGPPEMRASR